MNYLAHAYLSFNHPQLLAGNMISDFVKGKKQYEYALPIQAGIKLHRAIDHFTDTHPVIKEMKLLFKPDYGLYAGAFTDIVCDYFLANDKDQFNTDSHLAAFSKQTYQQLEQQLNDLPQNFQQVFVYMKQYDWLYNYRYTWGIQKSFAGMGRRAKYIGETDTAYAIFEENIPSLKRYYETFFPLLKAYSFKTWNALEKAD
jgi:acyl carrier protein phosphodiesterase